MELFINQNADEFKCYRTNFQAWLHDISYRNFRDLIAI